MRQDDRPYLEIRITLIHIVIMIVAVILLGFLLTYLGYKAGKASNRDLQSSADVTEFAPQSQSLTLPTNPQAQTPVPLEEVEPAPASSQPLSAAVQSPEPALSAAGETAPPEPSKKPAASAIEEELRLHKSLSEPAAPDPKPGETIRSKPVTDQEYFAVQVGAFGNFQNAKTYANRFNAMGYKTEIVSSEGGSGTLYRVWVGRYPDRNQAMQEKDKLEKMEKKKFSLVSNRR